MAKTYEKLKTEWSLLEPELVDAAHELRQAVQSRGQMDETMQRGAMEIGKRVRELREGGWQGDKLSDYVKDPAVLKMDTTIKKSLAGIEKSVNQVKADAQVKLPKLVLRYDTLVKDLDSEIKTRSLERSTIKGTGNKSLPDLKKLLEAVAEKEEQRDEVQTMGVKKLPKLEAYEKNLQEYLTKALNESKELAHGREKNERLMRLLDVRLLRKNFGLARQQFNELKEAAEAGKVAQAGRDVVGLSAAKQNADKSLTALTKMVEPYLEARRDPAIKGELKDSKDKTYIEEGLESMKTMLNEAQELEGEVRARRLA